MERTTNFRVLFRHVAITFLRRLLLAIFLLLIFLLFSQPVFASDLDEPRAVTVQDADWKFHTSVQGVEFYHAIRTCNGVQVVFLKMVNKNKYSVNVSWKDAFDTQSAKGVNGMKGQKKVVLPQGTTSETTCDKPQRKEFVIQSPEIDPTYVAEVSAHYFKDISISRS